MAWITANYQSVAVVILAVAEIISLFLPKSSGTLAGIISAIKGIPGVKDPNIGK